MVRYPTAKSREVAKTRDYKLEDHIALKFGRYLDSAAVEVTVKF